MENLTQGTIYEFNNLLELKGDFIGFTFDGIHSSELGIVRTSGGDRYEESLIPSSNIKTTTVPGGDGTYYFGSDYTQRNFNIDIAYDSLTQVQLDRLVRIFGTKKIVDLIFDETPYKVYKVKINGDPRLTYLCFDENNKRIYKGEGSIPLVCYSPFARSRYKYREDYTVENIPEWSSNNLNKYDFNNLDEWIDASGIKSKIEQGKIYDTYSSTSGEFLLYNGGHLPTDFKLSIPFGVSNIIQPVRIALAPIGNLYLKEITKIKETDAKIRINTKTNLIEGINSNDELTGSIYNKYIEKGMFFKIPLGESTLSLTKGIGEATIEYNFLYY